MDIKGKNNKQRVWQDFKPAGANVHKPIINKPVSPAKPNVEIDLIEKEILLEKFEIEKSRKSASINAPKKSKKIFRVPKPNLSLKTWSKKSALIVLLFILVAVGSGLLFYKTRVDTNDLTAIRKRTVASKTPEFSTVTPSGKTIQDLGGWGRVSPPDSDPVFAYIDKIGEIPIQVSEQPLPKEFVEDTAGQIQALAEQYAANDQITVGETTVYIGTSAKGPQSVILTKNNLLILIKSTSKIDDERWKEYISSLQ